MSGACTATAFLNAMFRDAEPGTHSVLCAFPGNPLEAGAAQWGKTSPWWPGRRVPAYYARENAYVTVSTFLPGIDRISCPGQRRLWRPRRKGHFAGLHAVMVDDVGMSTQSKVAPESIRLPLSALIETSPGNHQGWLFIRQDEDSRHRPTAERLIDRMIATGLTKDGTDPGMAGVTRYGRLPCGINGKPGYLDALGRAFQVTAREFNPERCYSVREIAEAFALNMAPDPEPEPAELTGDEVAGANAEFQRLLEFFREHGWYRWAHGDGWHEVQCPWESAHESVTATGAALAEPSAANHWYGGFRCWHKCKDLRGIAEVWAFYDAMRDAEAQEQESGFEAAEEAFAQELKRKNIHG